MEESCSGEKRKKGDHRQRPEQMSKMAAAAAGISGIFDPDVLDCTICFDPLRPPVFQGHKFLRSFCQELNCPKKFCGGLINKENCNMCSLPGGYNRCHALEKILESLHIPCANAAYGCTVKTHYHEVEDHGKSCSHAPCFCPEPGCNFAGSTAALLVHLTGSHMWPSTELEYNVKLTLEVKTGVHVLHRRDRSPFFLVKFTPAPPPYGNAASVLCVDPDAATTMEKGRKFRCQLGSSNVDMDWQQYSRFQVSSTTLSDGWPPAEDGGSLSVVTHLPDYMQDASSGNKILYFASAC